MTDEASPPPATAAERRLAEALQLHQRGELVAATALYESVLAEHPDHPAALQLLGVLQAQRGNHAAALKLLAKALQQQPRDWSLLHNVGNVPYELGKVDDAIATLGQSLAVKPDNATVLISRGAALLRAGNADASLADFDRALLQQPDLAAAMAGRGRALHRLHRHQEALQAYDAALQTARGDAITHCNRGIVLMELGRPADALAAQDAAVAADGNFAEGWCNRAAALRALGRFREALDSIDRALAVRPKYVEAAVLRGAIVGDSGDTDAALAQFDQVLAQNPAHVDAWTNRGRTLLAAERPQEALDAYEQVVALRPDLAEGWSNRGVALQHLERFEEALASFDRALALRPSHAAAWSNRGNALTHLLRLEEAVQCYDRALASYEAAIQMRPDYEQAHWNAGLLRLLAGDFERGWEQYEWRLRKKNTAAFARTFDKPAWDGTQDLRGKTILLYAEQGFGDTVQFCRYVPLVARRGANVVLEVQPALQPLLARMHSASAVIARGERLPAFDLHCSLLSLPHAFRTTLDTIPAQIPYVSAAPNRMKHWAEVLGDPERPRVGIVWAGSATNKNDHNRSAALADLSALRELGAELISLQKELRPEDAPACEELGVRHFGAQLTDFAETAALLANVDAVVSVDTSVAHLAGALGKDVWILLPFYGLDWRWLLDRNDSPWYPTARLVRQKRDEPWRTTIATALEAIRGAV